VLEIFSIEGPIMAKPTGLALNINPQFFLNKLRLLLKFAPLVGAYKIKTSRCKNLMGANSSFVAAMREVASSLRTLHERHCCVGRPDDASCY